jgi:hypothetical protein
MPAYQMRSAGAQAQMTHRCGCSLGDAPIPSQAEIIIAAERQVFPASDTNVRTLCGFHHATAAAQALPFNIGEFCCEIEHYRISAAFRLPYASVKSLASTCACVANFHRHEAKLVEQHPVAVRHGIGRCQQLFAVENRICTSQKTQRLGLFRHVFTAGG